MSTVRDPMRRHQADPTRATRAARAHHALLGALSSMEAPPASTPNMETSHLRPRWASDIEASLNAIQTRIERSETAVELRLEKMERAVRELKEWRLLDVRVENLERDVLGFEEWRAQGECRDMRQHETSEAAICVNSVTVMQTESAAAHHSQPVWAPVSLNTAKDKPQEDNKAGEGCALKDSVWDASITVWLHPQELASSAWTGMLLFLNLLVQGTFTYIVLKDLAKAEIDKGVAEGLRTWRTNIGHSPYALLFSTFVGMHMYVRMRACVRAPMRACVQAGRSGRQVRQAGRQAGVRVCACLSTGDKWNSVRFRLRHESALMSRA